MILGRTLAWRPGRVALGQMTSLLGPRPAGFGERRIDSEATIRTYDQLATEYDRPAHATTGALVEASLGARRRASRHLGDDEVRVIELGAGTGRLTAQLLRAPSVTRVEATDPSAAMLRVARARLDASGLVADSSFQRGTAREVLAKPPDTNLIVAGLADPFLDHTVFDLIADAATPRTMVFITVPSRRWAARERQDRLGIPIELTQFRLRGGQIALASSWTYDDYSLQTALVTRRLDVVARGFEVGPRLEGRPRPEIAWVMGRRRP
jgi:SAM-dependent methyltransferase